MTTMSYDSLQTVVEGYRLILKGLGLDPVENPHLRDTPERAAKAMYEELCIGLYAVRPKITTFESNHDQMILLKDVPILSLCAHHLLPFIGHADIAYVPGGKEILGLSKLSRIANWHARRPQVQEGLTEDIAEDLSRLVIRGKKGGAAVKIQANHMCMHLRGVKHPGNMVTSALRGVFLTKPEARAEFFSLCRDS